MSAELPVSKFWKRRLAPVSSLNLLEKQGLLMSPSSLGNRDLDRVSEVCAEVQGKQHEEEEREERGKRGWLGQSAFLEL